jgi:hypothetical protein
MQVMFAKAFGSRPRAGAEKIRAETIGRAALNVGK